MKNDKTEKIIVSGEMTPEELEKVSGARGLVNSTVIVWTCEDCGVSGGGTDAAPTVCPFCGSANLTVTVHESGVIR